MVSGRAADAVANCRQCGKELILFAYADRDQLICPACESENEPAQLPLFNRSTSKAIKTSAPKPIPTKVKVSHYLKCEGCMNPDCYAPPNGCDCCRWVPNTGFYWDGYGVCCQRPTQAIIQRFIKRKEAGWMAHPAEDR